MKPVLIVQARMTSTRLPGKVLLNVLHKPLLAYQIERLKKVQGASALVVATTTNDTDNPIVDLCDSLQVPVFRGSEKDVLSRYYGAASQFSAQTIVRITSDCPLIDPAIVDSVISYFEQNQDRYDYVSNCLKRTFPRGMDTEVFSMKALEMTQNLADSLAHREHVTPYLRESGQFRLANVAFRSDESRYRLTVDTAEDFSLIRKLLESLYPHNPNFTLDDILQELKTNPDWMLFDN